MKVGEEGAGQDYSNEEDDLEGVVGGRRLKYGH